MDFFAVKDARRKFPSPIFFALSARNFLLTNIDRNLVRSPSSLRGKFLNKYSATTRSRTASPRNSRRSFEIIPIFNGLLFTLRNERCVRAVIK